MSNRVDHQRLNNQKRTIKRGADSRRALSDEALENLQIMRTYTNAQLKETLNACVRSAQLLPTTNTSKADQRAREYLYEVAKGIQKILNSR
jgi:hypothetical protein